MSETKIGLATFFPHNDLNSEVSYYKWYTMFIMPRLDLKTLGNSLIISDATQSRL